MHLKIAFLNSLPHLLGALVNTLRPRQNGRNIADDIFKCIFLNENFSISNKISLKYVPWCLIDNMAALVQIMAWRRPGTKPLSVPMMFSLLMHICFARPQWVKILNEPGIWEPYINLAHACNGTRTPLVSIVLIAVLCFCCRSFLVVEFLW